MFRTFALIAAALLAMPQPAFADVASNYRDAFALFLPSGDVSREAATLASVAMIPALEGRWLQSSLVFAGAEYNPEIAATGCERTPIEIAPNGHYGFTMTRIRSTTKGSTTTYALVGANTFARLADFDALILDLFGDAADAASFTTIGSILGNPLNSGTALVHMVAPDILVIETPGLPADIFTRCPAP